MNEGANAGLAYSSFLQLTCLILPVVKTETREELLRSKSFTSWTSQPRAKAKSGRLFVGQSFSYLGKKYTNLIVNEKHYTVSEIAQQWGISTDLVRDTFTSEPGVLKFVRPGTRVKRGYSTIRIPESVMVRVHTRLSSGK
jgi:hypothetical protein